MDSRNEYSPPPSPSSLFDSPTGFSLAMFVGGGGGEVVNPGLQNSACDQIELILLDGQKKLEQKIFSVQPPQSSNSEISLQRRGKSIEWFSFLFAILIPTSFFELQLTLS